MRQTSAFVCEGARGDVSPRAEWAKYSMPVYVVPERITAVPSPRRGDGGVPSPPSGSFTSNSCAGTHEGLLQRRASVCFPPLALQEACWISGLRGLCVGSLVAQLVKNPPAMQEAPVGFLGWEDPLEKGKAAHSGVLAWRIHGLYSPRGHREWSL